MNRAGIALGANLGRPTRTFERALESLACSERIELVRVSSLYRSAPWGVREQGEFLNAVALVDTSMEAQELLARMQEEERRAGRERGRRWGPRTLDLDLLFYSERQCTSAALSLPHPGIAERSFVLEPLAEIAPVWRHPTLKRSAQELLGELVASGRATECVRLGAIGVRWVSEVAT